MVHKKMLHLTSPLADAQDLTQVGVIAAVRAYERWQPGREASWLSFVLFRAHGAIIDEYRRLAPGSRGDQAAGRNPDVFSMDAGHLDSNGWALQDQLVGDPDVDLSEAALDDDADALLRRAIARLTPYEQTVIELLYFEDMRLHEIGGLMGFSESRASQLHSAALRKLRGDSTLIEAREAMAA